MIILDHINLQRNMVSMKYLDTKTALHQRLRILVIMHYRHMLLQTIIVRYIQHIKINYLRIMADKSGMESKCRYSLS